MVTTTGAIACKRHNSFPAFPECFEQVLANILTRKDLNPKAIKRLYEFTGMFFRWLSAHGYLDLNCIDECVVREFLTECSSRLLGNSLDIYRRTLKKLLLFLSEDGALTGSMNRLFLFKIPIKKKIQSYMPQDEIAAVLKVIDQNTAIGKRDYAIILLAAVTGLRSCDIAALTLDSIDWRNGEIRIIQEKTGKALALPLTTDVGKAIKEYILTARPHSNSDKVFLCSSPPFNMMGRGAFNSNLYRYCTNAGKTRRSMHTLRRSVATNMIKTGVSVLTVAQALGQTTINPTKEYICLDNQGLKECALDFHGIEIGGKAL